MINVAYIARGRLFVKLGDDEPREVESPFAEDVAARGSRIARKNAWKTSGSGARFMRGFGGTPDDVLEAHAPDAPIAFVGLARGRHEGELLYALASGPVSGVFAFSSGEETRLFHGADFHVDSLACSRDGTRIVCSARGAQGHEHLALMSGDGSDLTFITEGDCLDGAPTFAAGSSQHVTYCSRGFGYDGQGQHMGFAPAVIERLDLDTGTIERLVSNEDADCTSPKQTSEDTIYFVERPRQRAYKPSPFRIFLDILLIPFRLIGAVFSYLSFFVMKWSGKRLIQSGSASAQRADAKRLWEAQRVSSAIEGIEDDPALEAERGRAPKEHVLVRRRGSERATIAERVACFDVADDGTVVYADGRDVFVITPGGEPTKIVSEHFVTHVIAVPEQPE